MVPGGRGSLACPKEKNLKMEFRTKIKAASNRHRYVNSIVASVIQVTDKE